MGRLYYFLAIVAINVIGIAGFLGCAFRGAFRGDLMQMQTPEAVQAYTEQTANYCYAIYAIASILTLAATYFRLANAGMNKLLTLLMFVPLVNYFFMIFLFFKKGK